VLHIIFQLSETLVLSHVNDGYQTFCSVNICATSQRVGISKCQITLLPYIIGR
jgi:hypothetical protein